MLTVLVALAPNLRDWDILTSRLPLLTCKFLSEINAGFFYSNAEQREKMVAAERRQVLHTDDRNA